MLLDLDTLRRMMHEYYEGFEALFTDADIRLRRILKQKLRAISLCERGMIETDHEKIFDTKFKNTVRICKDDDGSEDSHEKKESGGHHHHHHHDHGKDNNECSGKIAFFKQSIPLKRLLEKSLSQTMQTPPSEGSSSDSLSKDAIESEVKGLEGTLKGGLMNMFNNSREKPKQQDDPEKTDRRMTIMDVFKKIKSSPPAHDHGQPAEKDSHGHAPVKESSLQKLKRGITMKMEQKK